MIAWLIVAGSLLFGAALLIAWLLRPEVRVWLEAPKYRFQNNVRRYDRTGQTEDRPGDRPVQGARC